MQKPIKIIDLFAGPGGLGEGFSALKREDGKSAFKIMLSVEKDPHAHKTLSLRAFYRQFKEGSVPNCYYDYLNGEKGKFPEDELFSETKYRKEVTAAQSEARNLTLGEDNTEIYQAISDALGKRPGPWVLIGGPPCQAYSIVGRSRNKGIKSYRPEKDHRNFLYREYLEIIARFHPSVFVMENVKGMLSAKVGGKQIFTQIKSDLECPALSLKLKEPKVDYELFSLSTDKSSLSDNEEFQPKDFIIKAEDHGVPQARHRVIIVGIQKKLLKKNVLKILAEEKSPGVSKVLSNLPKLRSGLSRDVDSFDNWIDAINLNSKSLIRSIRNYGLIDVANKYEENLSKIGRRYLDTGNNWGASSTAREFGKLDSALKNWYEERNGWKGVCNHEARYHIGKDLQRYLFCSSYAQVNQSEIQASPKAHWFPDAFSPEHVNWGTGHFNDRFRVQLKNRVATTITSHISKDGHYFIHYDPTQCRSLTVREAARLQTFPDSYFFVGPRTSQYVQVGNAVPPFLAHKIARSIYDFLI